MEQMRVNEDICNNTSSSTSPEAVLYIIVHSNQNHGEKAVEECL